MAQREPAARIEASLPMDEQECANSGHRKLLHLCFRGSEFNDGDQSNQNEDESAQRPA